MVGLNDVGVNQIGDQFGLADEVLDELFLVGIILTDHLDGDAFNELARAELLGLVHDAHAALENLPDDLVPKLILDGEKRHVPMLFKHDLKSSPRCPEPRPDPNFYEEFLHFLLAPLCRTVLIARKSHDFN